MKTITNLTIFCTVLLLIVSCGTIKMSDGEWDQILARTRNRIITKLPNLDTESIELIQANNPRLFVVHLPFGPNDYRFVWLITSNRAVELSGYGDFRNLDEIDAASVLIQERKPNSN